VPLSNFLGAIPVSLAEIHKSGKEIPISLAEIHKWKTEIPISSRDSHISFGEIHNSLPDLSNFFFGPLQGSLPQKTDSFTLPVKLRAYANARFARP